MSFGTTNLGDRTLRLLVYSPDKILVDVQATKVVADGHHGSFCLLPRHVDFVAALVPGLLSYELAGAERETGVGEHFLAVDEGVLVKVGDEVRVATRRAFRATELGSVRSEVAHELVRLGGQEKRALAALAKLEASFVHQFLESQEASRV